MADVMCGIIAPRQEEIAGFRSDGYLAECIRTAAHYSSPHIIKTPEGKYVAWEDDFACDCCTPEEDDRCYTFWEISEEEAKKIMEGRE